MTLPEILYTKGARVWIPHPNNIWESAILLQAYDYRKKVLEVLGSEETKVLNINTSADFPPLYLPEDVFLGTKKNLCSLTIIHEATIFHELRSRFEQRCYYSYCGGICAISINPYVRLTEKEKAEKILLYKNCNVNSLDPHIFGVAKKVSTKLERENRSQMIIFTGESGSGKSINTELAIEYLAVVDSLNEQVREKVLATWAILQAFGNARTSRNEDSSRFNKYIQIQYDKNCHIVGASFTIFNFDCSHVAREEPHRDLFKIYYYMYARKESLSQLHLDECHLDYLEARVDAYKQQNKNYFDKINDVFNTLGFSIKTQNEILHILAGLLHLRNLKFIKVEGGDSDNVVEYCSIADQNQLKTLGKVLSLDEKAQKNLKKWLCYRKTIYNEEEPMDLKQVTRSRDYLVGCTYARLLVWILGQMGKVVDAAFQIPSNVHRYISFLDVHGFEKLELNSLEQFCINYSNEKLEQIFIQSYFKLEQEQYIREEIEWKFLRFSDNSTPCVELIEGKHGILNLLEKESKTSRADDNVSWLENLRTKFNSHKCFQKSVNVVEFTIRHFFSPVKYDATDFLTKNCERIPTEILEVLKETKNKTFNQLILIELSTADVAKVESIPSVRRPTFAFKPVKHSVASSAQNSLSALCDVISPLKPHFVRCFKSNHEGKPLTIDLHHFVQQMRAYNVVDTIRLAAEGYFHQRSYTEFAPRYRCLCPFEDFKCQDTLDVCKKILSVYLMESAVKFGLHSIFLREDIVDFLEMVRTEQRHRAAVLVQKITLGYVRRKHYKQIYRFATEFQRYARGYLMRQGIEAIHDTIIREHLEATNVQAHARGFFYYRWFQYIRRKLPTPKFYKKQFKRLMGEYYSKDMAATEIQRHVKSFLARRNYQRTLKKIIIVQSYVRKFLATVMLKRLRKERRDLRSKLLDKRLQMSVDFADKKINYIVQMDLPPEELQSVMSIMTDNHACLEDKNRKLNDILLNKIKFLKDIRVNYAPCGKLQIQAAHTSQPAQFDLDNIAILHNFDHVDSTLHQSVNINFGPILKFMESYRGPAQSTATASTSNPEQRGHDKGDGEHKQPSQVKLEYPEAEPQPSTSRGVEISDIPKSFPYSFSKTSDQQSAEQIVDIDEESMQSMLKKSFRLRMFVDEDEPKETTPGNENTEMMAEKARTPAPAIKLDELCKQKMKEKKKFRVIIFGDENDPFERMPAGNGQCLGMFQFDLNATESVIYHLTDVGPSIFMEHNQSVSLPAQVLMMCIRYTDYENNYLAALSLLRSFIKRVKWIIVDYDMLHIGVFWLLNSYDLLNYLRQYSKKEGRKINQYHLENSDLQNQQRLRNFNLDDAMVELERTCQYIADWLIKEMKSRNIAPYLDGLLDTGEPTSYERPKKRSMHKMDVLLMELTHFYDLLYKYKIERRLAIQIFKPMFECISSLTLGNILSRSDVCNPIKALRIRHHLLDIESWIANRELPLIQMLDPVIQGVRLIENQPLVHNSIYGSEFYEKYNKLRSNEIIQIIELYNANCKQSKPSDYENLLVPPESIDTLKDQLEKRQREIDTKREGANEERSITFHFRPSEVQLERVVIPPRFILPMLKKI